MLTLRDETFFTGSHVNDRMLLWFFVMISVWRSYTVSSLIGLEEDTVSTWATLTREVRLFVSSYDCLSSPNLMTYFQILAVYLRHHPVVPDEEVKIGYAYDVWIGKTQKYGRGNLNRGVKDRAGK